MSDDTLPPVFFQHGGMMSADSWLGNQIDASSPFFALVDDGHHVYLGNNRGNEYSQSHTSISWPSAEFYDYDYSGYFYDVAAQTSAMMDNYPGTELGIYVGFSMGTLQWLGASSMGALGVSPYNSIAQNIQHAILLAPCTIIENQGAVGELTNLGIYSIPSDNWEVDQATICDTLGAESANCYLASYATAEDSGRLASKILDHVGQNYEVGVFGAYVDDWENSSKTVNPWPLEGITVPHTLIIAELDDTCPPTTAQTLIDTFSDSGILAGSYTMLNQTHDFFMYSNAEEYVDALEAEIANVIAGTAISVDGPFATEVTIVPPSDDDDDSAFNSLSAAFAVTFALLQFVF